MPSCDSYYRKINDVTAFQPEQRGNVEQQTFFKNDRELLAYLLKIEKQYDQHQIVESYSVAIGHR